VILLVALFQRRLIYVPARLSPSVAESSATQNGFLPWRNQANELIGWQMPANGASTGVVLIVHGNAGFAGDRDYLARPIHDAAMVDVFVLEYPGYGARAGSPSRASFIKAAEEAFALLPAGKPRYLVAESLGAGVATHLAKAHAPEVAGMALFVPYHSLAWVAQRTMPLLPAGLLLRDRFEPAEDLKSYQGPIKVVVAENDEVIPAEAGRRLFESYDGPKDLKVFAQARHNEVAEQSPEWWQGVFAFWETNAAKSRK
ncbi:MAG TPA: alpha/beta hydrolase, partial [Verrucomicrobiae bacterium]|nr:alpha/beta hydrolase [Verrucomicrobiae bacterium]